MRKLPGTIAAAALSLGLAACGGGQVTVQAAQQRADGSSTALPGLLVRLLPYDRDAVFSELARAYGRPEPTVPDSLRRMQGEIARANSAWSDAESLWAAARDSLQRLSDRMAAQDRASAPYAAAYREFLAQESMVQRAESVSKEAYQRFSSLQQRVNDQLAQVRRARAAWEEAAFAKVDSVLAARIEASGSREHADTTDANGVVRFEGVERGRHWVHARLEGPFTELYWNVPVVVGREPVTVQLNRETAQERPKL